MFIMNMTDYGSPIENVYILIEVIRNLNILEITRILFWTEIVFGIFLYMEIVAGFSGIILEVLLTGIIMLVLWIFFTYIVRLLLCLLVVGLVYIIFWGLCSSKEE